MKGKHTIIYPTIHGAKTAVPVTVFEAEIFAQLVERGEWFWVNTNSEECKALKRLVKKNAADWHGMSWRPST